MKIPTIVDGQQVGYTGLSKGEAYTLVKVDGSQVTIRVDKSDVVIPVENTDLLKRIERRQRGLKEGDNEDVTAALVGTWRQENGDIFTFSSDGTVLAIGDKGKWLRHSTWTVEENAVVIHWQNGAWDKFLLPIDPRNTIDVNNGGGHIMYSKVASP